MDNSILDKVGNILNNKLFLQYLSAAGADISAEKGLGPNVNAVTQQNIQAQNMMKLMKQFLGPDGSKATFSKDGVKINIPQDPPIMSSFLSGDETPKSTPIPEASTQIPSTQQPTTQPTSTQPIPTQPTPAQPERNIVQNPFNSGFSAADLAGLTPQDISAAFAYKMKQAEMSKPGEVDLANQDFPIPVPGIGTVKQFQWNALPDDMKEYAAYAHATSQSGKPVMTKEQYDLHVASMPTESILTYQALLKDPALKDVAIALLQAGAAKTFNIEEKVKEKIAIGNLSGQLYFAHPDWTTDLETNVEAFKKTPAGYLVDKQKQEELVAAFKIKHIENKIIAGGGEIIKVNKDKNNRTMIWTVKWPSNEITLIRHNIR